VSVIALQTAKAYLRVTHNSDDVLLTMLLDAAEQEAMRYCNRSELPGLPVYYPEDYSSETDVTTEPEIASDVIAAVCLLVRVQYEALDPDEAAKWRKCAETLLQPYRTEMGA